MRAVVVFLASFSLLFLFPQPLAVAQNIHSSCKKIEDHLEEMKNQVDPSVKDSLAVPYFMDLCARAVAGDHDAQFELAGHFRKGWHTPRDADETLKWYLAASDGGNLTAQAIAGGLLIYGRGSQSDLRRGLRMVRDAAEKKNPAGLGVYGNLLRLGLRYVPPNQLAGVEFQEDPERGIQMIREAAELGHADSAMRMAGFTSANGRTPESSDWLKKAAARGNAEAQYQVGLSYFHGTNGETDISKHLAYTMHAAINGSRSAREMLGTYHKLGTHNLPVNYDLAEFWYRKAVELGSVEGERQLAERDQWGVERETPLTQSETVAMGIFALFALGVVVAVLQEGSDGHGSEPIGSGMDHYQRYQQSIRGACAWMTWTESVWADCPP